MPLWGTSRDSKKWNQNCSTESAPRFNSTWPAWIIGYKRGTPSLFTGAGQSIDSFYLGGVSVTHGSPRQHIWSFSGGLDEVISVNACPCVTGNRIPSFVGRNYFCEAGITRYSSGFALWPDGDPLWDGQGCGPTSSCCTFNSPPWFNVQLSSPTTDDIEVRICGDHGIGDEGTPIQQLLIELYVKWTNTSTSTNLESVAIKV